MNKTIALTGLALGVTPLLSLGESPLRGLWVGEARLNYASEVTVPLDEDNVPRAPDPLRPTRTSDVANIRLLLHVDSAGQVHLLKDVAILKRRAGVLQSESDLSLVTDPRLYASFPSQPGQRIASAVFDFGDQKASDAIQAVMDAAVDAAASSIDGAGTLDQAALDAATQAARNAAQAVVDAADAEVAFHDFLAANLSRSQVDAIALATNPASTAQSARLAGESLQSGSFYGDGRGVAMVDAIVAAVEGAENPGGTLSQEEFDALKKGRAQNTAAAFADVENEMNRFLAGKIFGDLFVPVAEVVSELGVLRFVGGYAGTSGSSPVEVASPDHGLVTGEEVSLSGSGLGSYDGVHAITRISADVFSIPVSFIAGGSIDSFGGTANASPLEVTSVGHGLQTGDLVVISGAAEQSYNGEHEITVTGSDTFTIDVVVAATGAGGGSQWSPAGRGAWKRPASVMRAAAEAVPEQNDAQAEALLIEGANSYDDTRGTDAIAMVVGAMVRAAVDAEHVLTSLLADELVEVGRDALDAAVPRYPLPDEGGRIINPRHMAPTTDFSQFVRASNTSLAANFQTSAAMAAAAAAQGAFDEKKNNPLSTATSVRQQALVAAANDRGLMQVFAAAARANRTELPMEGAFAVGSGDPRFRADLDPGQRLGLAGLTGTVVLPAMHPTNPFRHRRHPDHTVGFDIVREIRLDFDGEPGDPLDRAGFGVDRITGIYREEVKKPANKAQGGLHKPLGAARDRGLIVEGRFELNRVSLIDTLNAK